MNDDTNDTMDAWVDHLNRMGIFADPESLRRHLNSAIDPRHEMAVWLRLTLADYTSVQHAIGQARS